MQQLLALEAEARMKAAVAAEAITQRRTREECAAGQQHRPDGRASRAHTVEALVCIRSSREAPLKIVMGRPEKESAHAAFTARNSLPKRSGE